MTLELPAPENETAPASSPALDAEPVLSLIRKIKAKTINPLELSAEERRRCVDFLWSEGCPVAEMGEILKVSERTIHRDRTDLRAAHALRVDPQFAPRMAGELMRQAECSISRLRRIARETTASAMERLMAETSAFKVYVEMMSKLQSMGYLPRVPNSVVAQVLPPGSEAIDTYDQLARRLEALNALDRELGVSDPKELERRRVLGEVVQRGRIAAEVNQLFKPSTN